jgi:fluoride ion exporter CrcB/FEX
MKKYQPSGQVSFGALILMLLAAIIGGAIAGIALWAVETYVQIYLVVAFPIIGAFLVGGLLTQIVRAMKVQNIPSIILAGIVGGLVLYGTYHFATYFVTFRGQVREDLSSPRREISEQDLDEIINEELADSYGQPGFIGYLLFSAEAGITINRVTGSSSSGGIELTGTGWWIFSAVEMGLAILVAAGTPIRAASHPIDAKTGQPYPSPSVIAFAEAKKPGPLLKTIKDGDWRQIGATFHTDQAQPYPRMEMLVARTQDPNADLYVEFHHVLKTGLGQRRGQTSSIQRGMISKNDFDLFQQALQQPKMNNLIQ